MTKSRTLRKAGAVALSLAMALSIAGTIPASAAAKKVKLSSTKGTIKVGKTKKVTIKNTKKSNIKKVTFKYSNTKKRVTAKRSGLTLKFTGKKAGTVTITSKITLKKAVAKKKTYSLKYKATVKKATPAPTATPGELKLDSVEGAQRSNGGNTNVIVAYFSAAVADFAASDVEIRRVSDNRLYTVEKVVPSSDKKTATLTLTGSTSAGTQNTEFLQDNTDYKLIVKTGSKTLEKVFSIPAVADLVTVEKVDAKAKKITVADSYYGDRTNAASDDEFTFADTETVDYTDLLGRTVTVEYDKNHVIKKLTKADETVVFGAFKVTDKDGNDGAGKNGFYKEAVSGKVYSVAPVQDDVKSSIYQTLNINNAYTAAEAVAGAGNANATYAWGKAVLNGNGSIRAFVNEGALASYALIDKVDGDIAYCGKEEINFKGYAFVDGKTGAGKTIADSLNNVVFYNTANKVAVISTETATGAISAVYEKSFKVGETSFDYKDAAGNATAKYIDGTLKDLTAEKLNSYKSSAKDITVYKGIDGSAKIVTGADGAAATTSITLILTKQPVDASVGYDKKISVQGYNPETKKIETYTLDVANLTSLGSGAVSVSFDAGKASIANTDAALSATGKKADGTTDTVTIKNDGLASATDKYAAGTLLTLTQEVESKKFVGFAISKGANLAQVGDAAVNATDKKFKKGYATINKTPVASDAVVYTMSAEGIAFGTAAGAPAQENAYGVKATKVIDNTASFGSVSHVAYSDYAEEVAFAADREVTDDAVGTADSYVFTNGSGKVSAIVLIKIADNRVASDAAGSGYGNQKAFSGSGETGTGFYAVVKSFSAGTGSGSNATPDSLSVVGADGEKSYNAFRSDYIASKANIKKGAFVKVTPYKDDATKVHTLEVVSPKDADPSTIPAAGGTVSTYNAQASIIEDFTSANQKWLSNGFDTDTADTTGAGKWTLADSYTVVKITSTGVDKVTWAEANQTDTKIWVHRADGVDKQVFDFAIISGDPTTAVADAAAVAAVTISYAGGTATINNPSGATVAFSSADTDQVAVNSTSGALTVGSSPTTSGTSVITATISKGAATPRTITWTATLDGAGSAIDTVVPN